MDCYIWGVPEGKNDKNTNLIKEMQKGDIVFFGLGDKIHFVGEVYTTSFLLKINTELTQKISNGIWGDEKYELLYFMKPVLPIRGEMEIFNEYVGYNKTAKFRGISKIANSTVRNIDDGKETIFRMWARGIIKAESLEDNTK